jgi:hypothetical protein
MTALVPLNEIKEMSEIAAKSKMFGFKHPDEALGIMLLCQAENLHPYIAMRDYHIVQGKPTLKADAMLARFQQAGGSVKWESYTDENVTGNFSHPSGGSVSVSWTMDMAKRIGLASKDNWRNYPRAMLRSRCISEGIRTVFPGCVVGVYTDDEIESVVATEPSTTKSSPVKDMGPAEIVEVTETEYPLYLPDGSCYAYCKDWKEYISKYADMVAAINGSNKFDKDTKKEKVKQWEAANSELVNSMDAATKVQLIAAKRGVTAFDDLEDPIE